MVVRADWPQIERRIHLNMATGKIDNLLPDLRILAQLCDIVQKQSHTMVIKLKDIYKEKQNGG
jgi:hypothetical protein